MTNEQPARPSAPPSPPRRDPPWRVDVPWPFLPVMLLVMTGIAIMAFFAVSRFFSRFPGMIREGAVQASILLAVLLMFALIPPIGNVAGKLGVRKLRPGDLGFVLLGLLLIYLWQFFTLPLWSNFLDACDLAVEQRQVLLVECGRSSTLGFLEMLAVAGVLIPFVEEVVFRRLIFGFCRPVGMWTALIATSLIFAAAHDFLYGLPALFGLGAVFQLQYLRTGNLLAPVLTHMIFNLISLTLVFAQSG